MLFSKPRRLDNKILIILCDPVSDFCVMAEMDLI